MVHPVGEQDVQGLVSDPLGDLRESRPAEDHPAAVVAGAAELCLFDGHETSRVPRAQSERTAGARPTIMRPHPAGRTPMATAVTLRAAAFPVVAPRVVVMT